MDTIFEQQSRELPWKCKEYWIVSKYTRKSLVPGTFDNRLLLDQSYSCKTIEDAIRMSRVILKTFDSLYVMVQIEKIRVSAEV